MMKTTSERFEETFWWVNFMGHPRHLRGGVCLRELCHPSPWDLSGRECGLRVCCWRGYGGDPGLSRSKEGGGAKKDQLAIYFGLILPNTCQGIGQLKIKTGHCGKSLSAADFPASGWMSRGGFSHPSPTSSSDGVGQMGSAAEKHMWPLATVQAGWVVEY